MSIQVSVFVSIILQALQLKFLLSSQLYYSVCSSTTAVAYWQVYYIYSEHSTTEITGQLFLLRI